jgi:drug/metabolite transporter (DMT)-like permease
MSNALPYSALILVQLIFGFNYSASKIILEQFPPVLWGAIRMAVSCVLMFALAMVVVKKEDRKMNPSFMKSTFVYSVFGIALCQGFFLLGLKHTTSANAAILNSMVPVFTLGFAILFGRESWTTQKGIGFLLAVLGVLVLRNVETISFSFETLQGDIYTLLNCASLAIFFTISRDFLQKHSALWATAWMFFFGTILLSFVGISELPELQPIQTSGTLWAAMIFNVLGATMVTYFLNSWTLKKVSSSSVSLFIYLQPVVAVANDWFFYDSAPTFRMMIAIVFIFFGVCLGVYHKDHFKMKAVVQ